MSKAKGTQGRPYWGLLRLFRNLGRCWVTPQLGLKQEQQMQFWSLTTLFKIMWLCRPDSAETLMPQMCREISVKAKAKGTERQLSGRGPLSCTSPTSAPFLPLT